jgi:hypothetical protein
VNAGLFKDFLYFEDRGDVSFSQLLRFARSAEESPSQLRRSGQAYVGSSPGALALRAFETNIASICGVLDSIMVDNISIMSRQPSDSHHLRFTQRRALSRKVSDEFTVPLCREHRVGLPTSSENSYHSPQFGGRREIRTTGAKNEN